MTPPRRTTLNLAGAMRGLGVIDNVSSLDLADGIQPTAQVADYSATLASEVVEPRAFFNTTISPNNGFYAFISIIVLGQGGLVIQDLRTLYLTAGGDQWNPSVFTPEGVTLMFTVPPGGPRIDLGIGFTEFTGGANQQVGGSPTRSRAFKCARLKADPIVPTHVAVFDAAGFQLQPGERWFFPPGTQIVFAPNAVKLPGGPFPVSKFAMTFREIPSGLGAR